MGTLRGECSSYSLLLLSLLSSPLSTSTLSYPLLPPPAPHPSCPLISFPTPLQVLADDGSKCNVKFADDQVCCGVLHRFLRVPYDAKRTRRAAPPEAVATPEAVAEPPAAGAETPAAVAAPPAAVDEPPTAVDAPPAAVAEPLVPVAVFAPDAADPPAPIAELCWFKTPKCLFSGKHTGPCSTLLVSGAGGGRRKRKQSD